MYFVWNQCCIKTPLIPFCCSVQHVKIQIKTDKNKHRNHTANRIYVHSPYKVISLKISSSYKLVIKVQSHKTRTDRYRYLVANRLGSWNHQDLDQTISAMATLCRTLIWMNVHDKFANWLETHCNKHLLFAQWTLWSLNPGISEHYM